MATAVAAQCAGKGLIFSGAMVRALWDGRKTQTRRLLKPQPWLNKVDQWLWEKRPGLHIPFHPELNEKYYPGTKLQHVAPHPIGTRIYVKETFRLSVPDDCTHYESCNCKTGLPIYRASFPDEREKGDPPWKPSIFMPKWAARIWLEVVKVRVERLNNISEEDAKAEGVSVPESVLQAAREARSEFDGPDWSYVDGYAALWDWLHGKTHPWSSNPWVWVYTFKPVNSTERTK